MYETKVFLEKWLEFVSHKESSGWSNQLAVEYSKSFLELLQKIVEIT